MPRLTPRIKSNMMDLIHEGKSLNSIVKLTGIGKSTIYYHFRKIKGRTIKQVKFNFNDEHLGEFCGIFAGDGYSFYHKKHGAYNVSFFFNNISENRYASELGELFHHLFGKPPLKMVRYDTNVVVLRYQSKAIYDLLNKYIEWDRTHITIYPDGKKICRKSHTVNLKQDTYSNSFKIGFIRGSIDSDGHINAGRRRAMFASASRFLATTIRKFLDELNIECYYNTIKSNRPNEVDMHHIEIRPFDFNNFMTLINPRNIKSAPGEI